MGHGALFATLARAPLLVQLGLHTRSKCVLMTLFVLRVLKYALEAHSLVGNQIQDGIVVHGAFIGLRLFSYTG